VIEKIHRIVMEDRRMKMRDIVEIIGISVGGVHNILHEKLEMKKLCARWMPRLLTIDQKRMRKDVSEQCLSMLKRNPQNFWRQFVTVDETWVHHYTPETKQQSKQWIAPGESASKKAKAVLSAGKVMATVFWDSEGIIFIDYLQKDQTITGEYYTILLNRLDEELRTKWPRLARKKVFFHQDNARVHTCIVAMAKLHELRFELLPHSPYSPDLAPCDFILFPNFKIWLGGKRFSSDEEVIAAVDEYFQGLESSYFSEGIKKLEHR